MYCTLMFSVILHTSLLAINKLYYIYLLRVVTLLVVCILSIMALSQVFTVIKCFFLHVLLSGHCLFAD